VTDPGSLTNLLVPCPKEWLQGNPVSSLVNSVNHDSVECIRPVKENRTLF